MKKIILCILLFSVAFLTSCDDPELYKENNPELQVVATNSLLGVFGSDLDVVSKLEEDAYGRTLFAYEGQAQDGIVCAVLIAQKYTSEKSYYYDNSNFIVCKIDYTEYMKPLNIDFIKQYFSDNQLQKLKDENDWNKQLEEDKFFEVNIQRKKNDKISEKKQKQVYEEIMETDDFNLPFSTPLTTDKTGKTIYLMTQYSYNGKTAISYYGKSYLVMFDSNGEVIDDTGTRELKDRWNYLTDLKEFKEVNGWSFYSK